MNARMVRILSKVGEKKELVLENLRYWYMKRQVLSNIRSSARKGDYSHSEAIEYKWSKDRIDGIVSFLNKKGYVAKSRTGTNFFGLITVIEIEWGDERNE